MRDPFRQTAPATPYAPSATALADALEAVMADGTHDLAAIVAALNARSGSGTPLTVDALRADLAALADA